MVLDAMQTKLRNTIKVKTFYSFLSVFSRITSYKLEKNVIINLASVLDVFLSPA